MRLFLAAALGVSPGAAQAGGPVALPAEPEVAATAAATAGWDWTGFYVGLSAVTGDFNDGSTDLDT